VVILPVLGLIFVVVIGGVVAQEEFGIFDRSAQPPPAPTAKGRAADGQSAKKRGSAGTTSIGMKFVAIAGGSFQMGSPSSEKGRSSDETQHRVRLSKSFLMSTTEVTQGQWQAVMGSNPSGFSSCGADCPVENVSWFDAVKFANALSKKEGLRAAYRLSGKSVSWNKTATGYRLPTEAEWEYAARGGEEYVYSGSNTLSAVGWSNENSGSKTHKVAGKRANAWGLYDMSGNVYEWCWDWYGKDLRSSTDPVGAQSGDYRVGRGGSWFSKPAGARVADRDWYTPGYRFYNLGLRLVRTNP
jgi:formylglycine-generating enzyme required for sulfatase activity